MQPSEFVPRPVERNGLHLLCARQLEQLGDAEAKLQLGIRKYHAIGVPRDRIAGLQLVVASALSGHSVSFALCHFYEVDQAGIACTKDKTLAAALLRPSAERDHAVGEFLLVEHRASCIIMQHREASCRIVKYCRVSCSVVLT
jgi:hypothetical protein